MNNSGYDDLYFERRDDWQTLDKIFYPDQGFSFHSVAILPELNVVFDYLLTQKFYFEERFYVVHFN